MNAVPMLPLIPVLILFAEVFWRMGRSLEVTGAPGWLVYGSRIVGDLFLFVMLMVVAELVI